MRNPPPPVVIASHINRGFYLIPNRDEKKAKGLEVVCAGWEECKSDYRIDRDGFPYFALEFISSGNWELTTPLGKRQLGPGSVFSYGPGLLFSLEPLCKTGLHKYFVDFSGHSALRLLRNVGLKPGQDRLIARHRWLSELFEQLVEIRLLDAVSRQKLARMTLELIFARMSTGIEANAENTPAWDSFERCRNYLNDNYLRLVSISDAAHACGVSSAYLSRLFARYANESPKSFLDHMKMNYAAQQLLQNTFSVKNVAAETGYADVFHFSRVFRRCFGVSPSHFAEMKER